VIVSSEMVHPFVGVSWNGRGGCWWIVGTLLGPERTGMGEWAGRFAPLLFVSFSGLHLFPHQPFVGVGGGVWVGVPVVV
jgi:hypothetical protein